MITKSLPDVHTDCPMPKCKPPAKYSIAEIRNDLIEAKELLKMAKCPNCDGSGGIPVCVHPKRYCSADMASDAGDPSMEGCLVSDEEWELEQCQWCYEKDKILNKQ